MAAAAGSVSTARPGARDAGGRPAAGARPTVVAALVGLVLGLLALGSGLRPGYLLAYDMVFVPAPRLDATMFGLTGTLPRAVPSDAVVTAFAQVLPADAVQKGVLLAIFVLACAGAARLLDGQPRPARLAAGVFYAWNPYVAERLLIGQWALLLGYAGLPWVLAAATRWEAGASVPKRGARLLVALLPAAVSGFAGLLISALVALPAAALRRAGWRDRAVVLGTTAGLLALLSLPWLIPSLAHGAQSSPTGAALFAARADTPFGTVGSVLALGGVWNAQTVPAGYAGAVTVFWLSLVLVALAGFLLRGRGRWPGAGLAAVAGLVLALAGVPGPGLHLLEAAIRWWGGVAVLRDGQQFVAPLAVVEAAGFGLAVGWVLQAARPRLVRDGRVVLAAALAIAPVVFLPGLAFGAADRLRPVQYPASWLTARRIITADPHPGSVLLLPWAAYRRPGWNHGVAVLDPWPRLLTRTVIWNDGVQVGSVRLPPENPTARSLAGPIAAGRPLTPRLVTARVRYVIVDAGPDVTAGSTAWHARLGWAARVLPGCAVAYAAPGLVVYRVPGGGASQPLPRS
jgi:hypothetical protein